MSKLGRNDPCSCGSGKKFKKCCLDKPDQEWLEWFAADQALGQQRLREQEERRAKAR